MLTRLSVQGFKNLLDLTVRFGPFTCVAGGNGVGKSNLFDAIRFLHLLTQHPIMEAVQLLREAKGRSPEPRSLFTTFGSFRSPELRLEADLILNKNVRDDFGVEASSSISTVRYTVAFRLNDSEKPERLELVEESLRPVSLERARQGLGFPASADFRKTAISGRRTVPFVSTEQGDGGPEIRVHQEGHGGRILPAPKSSRTVLGGLASSDFPTLLAAHREMASWQTLLLEPSAMRAPADYRDPRFIDTRGAYLPAAVDRLRRQENLEGETYASVANRLAELIDDVREVGVVDDEKTETFTLQVRGRDGVFHAARSLSDGTLRFLVLATLAVDPETTGLICLEEPENGIHPTRIPSMVQLLRDIAVDPSLPLGDDNPLRQVVINTHAPVVVEKVEPDELVYLETLDVVRDGSAGRVAHLRVPEGSWRESAARHDEVLPRGLLRPYLRHLGATEEDTQPVQLWLEGFPDSISSE